MSTSTPRFARLLAVAAIALTGACTTLGPMPTTTGVSPIPHQKPGLDAQAGTVPGAHVSSMTQEDPSGSAFAQVAATFEPDRLLGVPGLIAGGRFIANDPNQLEPYLGWRGFVDPARTIAIAAIGFGTTSKGSDKGATLESSRIGAEVTADANLTGRSTVAELHLVGGVTALGMWATGSYCVDGRGYGVDCPDSGATPIDGSVSTILPAGRAGIAIDFLRGRQSAFHGGRLELTIAGGSMPQIINGAQDGRTAFASGGLTLTLGAGAAE